MSSTSKHAEVSAHLSWSQGIDALERMVSCISADGREYALWDAKRLETIARTIRAAMGEKFTIEEVFIDIDDTLNSFTMRCLRHFGWKVGDFDYCKFPTEFQFNIVDACNHLLGTTYNIKEFWNAVPRRVWYTCPKSQEFNLILEKAQALVPKDRIYLLTAPTKDPECLAGKLDWIQDNLPEWIHRQYFVTPRKHLLAAPGRLFIDDADHNIEKWNQHGGTGLLVPRPWNHLHGIHAWEYLDRNFKTLLDKQAAPNN